jgi:hypothetical protein
MVKWYFAGREAGEDAHQNSENTAETIDPLWRPLDFRPSETKMAISGFRFRISYQPRGL